MFIKNLATGQVRPYGSSKDDSIRISDDGKYLTYENLRNGDNSFAGYRFCTEEGLTPEETNTYKRWGADTHFFNMGGFSNDNEESKEGV